MLNSVTKFLWGGSSENEQDYTDKDSLARQHGTGEQLETQQEEDWVVVRTADKENSLELTYYEPPHRHHHRHHTHHHNHHHHHSHASQSQPSLGGHDSPTQDLPGISDAELLDDAAAVARESLSMGGHGQAPLTDNDSDIFPCPLQDCGWVNQDFDKNSDSESLPESVLSACSGKSHATYHPGGYRSEPWVVAPAPCFTGSRVEDLVNPIASSPLENLLIEHPSMSVYLSLPCFYPYLSNCPADETVIGEPRTGTENDESSKEPPVMGDRALNNERQTQRDAIVLQPRNPAAINSDPFSNELVKNIHLAQRLQYNKAQKMISKTKCERQNRVHESNAKGNNRRNKRMRPSGFRASRFNQRI